MYKVWKIMKINLLSLIALPLLLAAVAAKLAAKAFEKLLVLVGVLLAFIGVGLIFEFLRNPGAAMNGILLVIVCLVIGGIFTALIFLALSIFSSIIMMAAAAVMGILNVVYEVLYGGFTFLINSCQEDYEALQADGGPLMALACLIYTLLRVINRGIILFVTHALKIFIVCSVLLVGISLFEANASVNRELGLNLFAFLGMFSAFEIVYGVALYLTFMAGIIIVLLSLGVEWSEWGREMDAATAGFILYDGYEKDGISLQDNAGAGTEADAERVARCMEYLEKLEEHAQDLEDFYGRVSPIVEKSSNMVLRGDFGQYINTLNAILEEVSGYQKGVPLEALEKLWKQIKKLDGWKQDILKRAMQQEEASGSRSSVFFSGCNTAEKLDKRYKALCKTYHPDGEAGDEETFKQMQEEYESRKARLS